MLLNKRTGLLYVSGAVVLLLVLLGVLAINSANKKWNDPTTWSAESRLLYPAVNQVIRLSEKNEDIDESGNQAFTISVDYCYLYNIKAEKDQITMECSLLPYYYAQRQAEVPKDWKEKSDIYLVIKPTDPEPSEFLGRIGKGYELMSSLGSEAYPVAIEVAGTRKYPTATLTEKLKHLVLSLQKRKQEVSVTITSYSVKRLDTATQREIEEEAAQIIPQMYEELHRVLGMSYKSFSDPQKALNEYGKVFENYRLMCRNLDECIPDYGSNPADAMLYYWYSLEHRNRDEFEYIYSAMKKNVPFATTDASYINEGDWTQFLAGGRFPMCPIRDIISGKSSQSASYIKARKSSLAAYYPENDAQASSKLAAVVPDSYVEVGAWDAGLLRDFDGTCLYIMEQGYKPDSSLAQTLIQKYYVMVETMLGVPLPVDMSTVPKILYESRAYSPYNSYFVLDYQILKQREKVVEQSSEAAGKYTDIRSIWNTLILMYLYEK